MLNRAVLAVVIGIVTWIAAAFVGLLVAKFVDGDIGHFITNISVLFGVLAGVWYYFAGRRLV